MSVNSLIQVVILLIILGVIWWLVDTQIPIAEPIKVVIKVICVLALCIWLLQIAGLIGPSLIR